MAEMYAVPGETLTEIADAIRLKRDTIAPIEVDDMAMQIGLIGGMQWYTLIVDAASEFMDVPKSTPDDNSILIYSADLVGFPSPNSPAASPTVPLFFGSTVYYNRQSASVTIQGFAMRAYATSAYTGLVAANGKIVDTGDGFQLDTGSTAYRFPAGEYKYITFKI